MTDQYQLGDYVRIQDHDGEEITVQITDSGVPNRFSDFMFKAGAHMFKNSEILGLGDVPVTSKKKWFEIGNQVVVDGLRRAVVVDVTYHARNEYRVQYFGGNEEDVSHGQLQFAGLAATPAPDTEVHAEVETENDAVNHPAHYTSDPSGVECIQITRHRNFNIGNAIKYLWRAGLKQSGIKVPGAEDKHIEDLRKAIFYINDEITRLGELK